MAEHDDLFDMLMDVSAGATIFEEKERMKWVRAPFGMPGGKYRSLQHIIPEIKKHLNVKDTWVDVFGGTGIVSFNVTPCNVMVFNDRYSGITDFYKCLRDHPKELIDLLHQFPPHSRQQFYDSKTVWCTETNPLKRAAHWFYVTRLSVIGKGDCFGRGICNKFIPLPKALEDFSSISWLMRSFTLENLDFRLLMADYDSERTLFYVDPPYLDTDPGIYEHCWTSTDLKDLLRIIGDVNGRVIMSHYPNKLIDSQDYWDTRIEWNVTVTSNVQVIDSENNKASLSGLESTKEVIWIKE